MPLPLLVLLLLLPWLAVYLALLVAAAVVDKETLLGALEVERDRASLRQAVSSRATGSGSSLSESCCDLLVVLLLLVA